MIKETKIVQSQVCISKTHLSLTHCYSGAGKLQKKAIEKGSIIEKAWQMVDIFAEKINSKI